LVTGLVCHHHWRNYFHQLDASVGTSGPHDFAVRNVARSSVAPPASTASQPYVRDDRETPLCVGRDGRDMQVIWVKWEQEYFCEEGWTGRNRLNPKKNFFSPVIPGRAKHEPGIHSPCRDYGFRACAKWRIPE
jgi:hypothetical protein